MLHDIRYAARTLTRTPGFTAIAILSIALGIGGTSAVFSLFRAVFLTPLPFPDADRIVTFTERRANDGRAALPISGHEYAAWKSESKAFERIAMYRAERVNLTGGGEPETIGVLQVSSDFFPALALRPTLGRTFVDGEDKAGSNSVVILSEVLWRRRFGADEGIIDKTITLNDRTFTVVGVMQPLPRALTLDAWIPINVLDQLRSIGRHNLSVIARLAPGISVSRAQSDLTVIADRLSQTMPAANTGPSVHIMPLRESLVGEFRTAMVVLLAAVGSVLLIACANVANLLLSRGAGRLKELALRSALGARQRRLVRQLLVESVMLAAAGGLIGVLLAAWIVDLVPAMTAVEIPLIEMARVDAQTLGVTAILALLTGMLSPLNQGRFFSDGDARLSLPLIRWFAQQPRPDGFDRPQPMPVALVSEAAARQFWPGEDPLGRRIRILLSPEITIVGVVGDVKHHALNAPAFPHVYLAANQEPWSSLSFVVRTSGSAVDMATLREQVRAIDPSLPASVRPMDEVRLGSVSRERFYVVLIGVFGAVALGLAIIGILGVVSRAARQRTLEIRVRLALGANRREITRLIASQGMRPIAVGVLAGAAGAITLSGSMQKLLYVEPTDPVTFVAVTILLVGVALLACWIPAARAARLDPMVALRSD